LNLKGFDSLKHLICHDNQLESIDLSSCKELEIIDCQRNKLKEITFGSKLKLKEFRGSDNEFDNLESIIDHIENKNLTYFDINNNKISGGRLGLDAFAEFKSLKGLFIGSSRENKKNDFCGSLKDLKDLDELLEIDIRGNNIKIKDEHFSKKLKEESL